MPKKTKSTDLPQTALVGPAGAGTFLGKGKSTIYRWRKKGVFPLPDLTIDDYPWWTVATLQAFKGKIRSSGSPLTMGRPAHDRSGDAP